jgi:DNA-binding NarL/FixJ family response regulator
VLVDDDARFRTTARRALVAEGVDVVAEVADGDLVGAVVERWHPDVVLVDIRMPGVDGLEVARQLHVAAADVQGAGPRPGVPAPTVILMSTVDETYGRQLAADLAAGYLPKHELSLAAIRSLSEPPRRPAD